MELLNARSTQSISKFLRTTTDISEITKVINTLLDDSHCVLPNKKKFILELIANRLASDINSVNHNAGNDIAKRQKRNQMCFYDNVEIWKIIRYFLTENSVDDRQEIRLIKSIKYLDLFNIILLKQNTELLIEFINVFWIVLRRNLLQLPMYLNKNNYYFQKFLTIASNYLSLSNDQILSNSKILFTLFNYMKNNGTIDVEFNNPRLLAQTFKLKDIVKFYKDNSQFIVQFFISNNLLDKLLFASSTLSSEKHAISNENFDKLLNELIYLFIRNSITFEVDDFTKFNFSSLVKHFNFFIQDGKTKSDSVSPFSAIQLYKLILVNVIDDTKKYHGYSDLLNETLVLNLMKFKKVNIEVLLEMNIENCLLTHFSSKYLSSFYSANSSGEERSFISISKKDLISKSTKEIESLYNESDFLILDKLILLDTRRNLNNNDFDNNDKNKSNLSQFAFKILWIAFHCALPYFENMITNLINHYSKQPYAFIYLLESYKEILFMLVTDNRENKEKISLLRMSNNLLLTKLSLLSIPQMDNQISTCMSHFERTNCLDYHWAYMVFLLKYLFSNHRLLKFVNNSNHKNFLVDTLSRLTASIKVKNELYYKSIYLILNILNKEIPDFMIEFATELTSKVDLKISKKINFGFYEMSLIFMTSEHFPVHGMPNKLSNLLNHILTLKDDHENFDKFDFLNLLFVRYFTLFALINDSDLVDNLVIEFLQSFIRNTNNDIQALLNILKNPLIYENQNVGSSIVDFLVKNLSSKSNEDLSALQKILLCVPVECFDKKSKVKILDNQMANPKTFNSLIVEYLLSINPSYESKIETDPNILFSSELLQKTDEKIVLLIVNNHIRRMSLNSQSNHNHNESSWNYLLSLAQKLSDFFNQKKQESENLNHAFSLILITNDILKAIKDLHTFNERFEGLRCIYSDFLVSYLEHNSIGDKHNKDNILVQSLILKSLTGVPLSLFKRYDPDTKIRIGKPLLSLLESISSMDLKISIFAVLPFFSHFDSNCEVNFSKFSVFYLELFTKLANYGNSIDFTESNKVLLYSNMEIFLRKLSEDNFFLLYSLVLTKEHNPSETVDIGTIDLFNCLLNCLKERKSDFQHIKWKKLLVDTCSKFLCIDFNELKKTERFPEIAAKIIETFTSVITNLQFLISQYSFELILLLIYKISSCYRMVDLKLYESLVNIISKILLVYRFRLAGRYHLLIEIYKMLLLKLTVDGDDSGIFNLNEEKTELFELVNLFTRSIGNLVQPNEQAAKTLTKKKSTLVSNVNLIKRDLRTHLPNLVLFYIKTSLSSSFIFNPQIKPLLQNDFIFLIFDLLSNEEFTVMNATLDFPGRGYYKTIYENYNKFGKWKSG